MRSARLFCILFALLAGVPVQAKEFRSADIFPTDYPTVQAVVQMDRLLRERSEDRHGITMLSPDERDSESDIVAHVRDGTLDMARVNVSALDPRAATIVPSLPFLFKSTAHARRILDGPVGDEILASLEAQGLVGLCFYDAGPRSFYSATRPIRTPADLKGLKVRVQQSDIWSAIMRALGAEPLIVPFDRVSTDLRLGAIDAADSNWPAYLASRHYTLAKYFSLTQHSVAPAVLIFSKRAWDELSREDQAMLRAAARESATAMRGLWDEAEEAAPRRTADVGGEIVEADRKAFADAMLPLYPTLVGDARLRALVSRIQSED